MSVEDLIIEKGTGSEFESKFDIINYPFEMYDIKVKLTIDGKFAGIEEVKINEDFRSYTNKTPQRIFSLVDEFPTE
jgi:hypothetical protein